MGGGLGTAAAPPPKNIALLLPLSGSLAPMGQAVKNGFFTAYYADPQSNKPTIEVYDTNQNNVVSLYQQAVSKGADFIVGPLSKPEIQSLIANRAVNVTTLALNTIAPNVPSNLYQFGLSPQDEAAQVAQRAWNDGRRQAFVIYQQGAWGQGIAQAFEQSFRALGGQVTAELAMSPNNLEALSTQMSQVLGIDQSQARAKRLEQALGTKVRTEPTPRQDIDMVFLATLPTQARLARPMLEFYYMGHVPVYATSTIYTGINNPQADQDLKGIIFCDMPWVFNQGTLSPSLSQIRQQAQSVWGQSFNHYPKLYAFGVDAYALANRLNTLIASPQTTLAGATGALQLNGHQVVRQLTWAQMRSDGPRIIR